MARSQRFEGIRLCHLKCEQIPTIAPLGTPRDVILQDVRLECFVPMDGKTS